MKPIITLMGAGVALVMGVIVNNFARYDPYESMVMALLTWILFNQSYYFGEDRK